MLWIEPMVITYKLPSRICWHYSDVGISLVTGIPQRDQCLSSAIFCEQSWHRDGNKEETEKKEDVLFIWLVSIFGSFLWIPTAELTDVATVLATRLFASRCIHSPKLARLKRGTSISLQSPTISNWKKVIKTKKHSTIQYTYAWWWWLSFFCHLSSFLFTV